MLLNNEYKFLDLPKVLDDRGNLTFLQYPDQVPFVIKRIFWIYDVPSGEIRGSHAYKTQQEIIIALSGSFDIIMDNGKIKRKINLNRSFQAIHVGAMMWRRMENFSTNATALIISDSKFKKEDYIRDYNEYLSYLNIIV